MSPCWSILILVAVTSFGACRNLLELNEIIQYTTKPYQGLKIKVMIHFDPALTPKLSPPKKHKNNTKTFKKLSQRILLEVENAFNHKSLEQNISFELLGYKILAKNNKKVAALMDENASKYLKNYCTWQAEKKTDNLYFSALFTGLDLYYLKTSGKKVKESTARGYREQMCSRNYSCTVIEWNETNAGFLLAHEIGHSLGIHHDGAPYNSCATRGFIMENIYDGQKISTTWSTCSRDELKEYLKSKKASCLKSRGRR